MPELPEVQTIIDDLNKKIKGEIIADFWSDWKKSLKAISPEQFRRAVKNKKILRARRKGKNIFIDLSGGKTIYLHLKMTGHLLVKPAGKISDLEKKYFAEKVNQYIHHIFYFRSGKIMTFSDLRKFGKIILVPTSQAEDLPEIKNLGEDVLSPSFTLEKFKNLLAKKRKLSLVVFLADQQILSGIGNIYRSEILFEAGVLPWRKAGELEEEEIGDVYRAIGKILKKAIRLRGTSDSDYRDTSGTPGKFQNVLRVYRREGEKCLVCKKEIRRVKIGARSVFYCPRCQNRES